MALVSAQRWESLENRRSTLFLVAGILFGINVVIVATGTATGSDEMTTLLGEAFNAAAWAVALVGLLGFYPGIADRSGWQARAGGVCAAIGVVVFTALSILSLMFYLEVVEGNIGSLVPLILPGVIIGGVLSFLLFGITSLRTDSHPRSIGVLLLFPPLIVVGNIISGAAGVESSYFLLGVVSGLLLVMLALGFRLRSSAPSSDQGEVTPKGAAK
ncbi:MAG: hypothetical protein ABEH81_07240 [Halopenitus sp.]